MVAERVCWLRVQTGHQYLERASADSNHGRKPAQILKPRIYAASSVQLRLRPSSAPASRQTTCRLPVAAERVCWLRAQTGQRDLERASASQRKEPKTQSKTLPIVPVPGTRVSQKPGLVKKNTPTPICTEDGRCFLVFPADFARVVF